MAVVFAATLAGCAPMRHSGRSILAELRDDGIEPPRAESDTGIDDAAATSLPGTDITLGDLFAAADRANPRIAAARSGVGVAAGQVWQAGLYPNPSGRVSVEDYGFREEFGSTDTTIGVDVPIVIGGRLDAATTAARAERSARLAEVEAIRRDVFGRIGELHANIVALRDHRTLLTELLEIARRTLATAEIRLEARAAVASEVIRPRVEVLRLESELARIGREIDAKESELGLAIGGVEISAESLAGALDLSPPPLDLSELTEATSRSHPDLVVADREIEAASARLGQIRAERAPDLEARVGVGYSEGGEQGIVELGLGMEIPLWDRRQGDILSARFDLMRARQQRLARRNDLLARLAKAHGRYEAAREQLDVLGGEIIPEAQRSFELVGEAYRAGRTSFLDMLDAQRTLVEVRRTMIDLAAETAAARAGIARIAGSELLLPSVMDGGPSGSGDSPQEGPEGRKEER